MSRSMISAVRALLAGTACFMAAAPLWAQEPPIPGPKVDWASMPTVSPTGKPDDPNDPMRPYYNSTTIGEYYPLWKFHIWYSPDGTHIMFYAHRYPDGTTHMGAAQRYWRLVGTPGHYGLCLRSDPDPKAKESCGPFDMHHYGELWWQDYDRVASGDIPTYTDVHEVFTFVEGKR